MNLNFTYSISICGASLNICRLRSEKCDVSILKTPAFEPAHNHVSDEMNTNEIPQAARQTLYSETDLDLERIEAVRSVA